MGVILLGRLPSGEYVLGASEAAKLVEAGQAFEVGGGGIGLRLPSRRRKAGPEPTAPSEVALFLPVTGGQEWPLMKTHLQALMEAYTACDVLSEVRKMCAWLASNPLRLKTYGGMGKFVNSWLARAHDCGGSPGLPPSRRGGGNSFADARRAEREAAARTEARMRDAEARRNDQRARESWDFARERPQ
jgi:hypothetical protein